MTSENFFLLLRQHYRDLLPFVVYNFPLGTGFQKDPTGTTVKALLQQDAELHKIKDYSESGFIFAPFDAEKEAYLIPANASEEIMLEEELSGKPEAENDQKPVDEKILGSAKEKHVQLVKKGIEAIKTGEMQKVVLSRREEIVLSKEDPLELFQDLLKNYPSAFVYCWFHPKVGLWLGATPETLVRMEGAQFKTMALAGTQKFKGTMKVEWGEKEKQEQEIVTKSILEKLQEIKFFQDEIKKSGPHTSRAGNLLHLQTEISGKLSSPGSENPEQEKKHLQQLLEVLHPTPAVCGFPKEKAREFILQEEGYDREFYTGFLGELNIQRKKTRSRNRRNVENLAYSAVRKQTSLFVNLRCMKIENANAILFIGGGITKDSIPEAEWQETVNKAQTMKKVLLK